MQIIFEIKLQMKSMNKSKNMDKIFFKINPYSKAVIAHSNPFRNSKFPSIININ